MAGANALRSSGRRTRARRRTVRGRSCATSSSPPCSPVGRRRSWATRWRPPRWPTRASTPSCGCRVRPWRARSARHGPRWRRHGCWASARPSTTCSQRVAAAPAGVKLKIAPGWDLEPLRAVRAAFPDRWLAADANGGYGVDDLPDLAAVDELGPHLPRAAPPGSDRRGRRGRACCRPPWCSTSRSATSTPSGRAIALGGLGGLNLKPGKGGGLRATARAIAVAAGEGIDVFVGGMLETGVGRARRRGPRGARRVHLAHRPRPVGLVLPGRSDRADRRRRRRPARRAPRAGHRGGARRRPPRRGHRRPSGAHGG